MCPFVGTVDGVPRPAGVCSSDSAFRIDGVILDGAPQGRVTIGDRRRPSHGRYVSYVARGGYGRAHLESDARGNKANLRRLSSSWIRTGTPPSKPDRRTLVMDPTESVPRVGPSFY